jgi:hypothetical protein
LIKKKHGKTLVTGKFAEKWEFVVWTNYKHIHTLPTAHTHTTHILACVFAANPLLDGNKIINHIQNIPQIKREFPVEMYTYKMI